MRTIRVAIAGLGLVGKHIAQTLLARKKALDAIYSVDIRIVAVCTSRKLLHDEAGITFADLDDGSRMNPGTPGMDWLRNEVKLPDVLFECGPSDYGARPFATQYFDLLKEGKGLILVSKAALMVYDHKAAEAFNGKAWMGVSGAGGAALPGLDLLNHSVAGCKINKIEGCLNATSNFVLDSLLRGQANSLAEAVKFAQSAGVAESDPSKDLGGFDSMAKLVLLANFGLFRCLPQDRRFTAGPRVSVQAGDVARSGINDENVTPEDIAAWRESSMTPRLVGVLERRAESGDAGQWTASVSLKTYPSSHPFASLHGTNKGFLITTEEMGNVFTSAAGPEPAATAASALKDFEKWLQWSCS